MGACLDEEVSRVRVEVKGIVLGSITGWPTVR
jgi:hypothetical protein